MPHGVRDFPTDNALDAGGTCAADARKAEVDAAVGFAIATTRESARVGISTLASHTKIEVARLIAIERGHARPTAREIKAVAEHLGVGISDLFADIRFD